MSTRWNGLRLIAELDQCEIMKIDPITFEDRIGMPIG